MTKVTPTINIMKSILTGSYAYGKPTRESDVDIVILCDKETAEILNDQLRPDSYFGRGNTHPSVDNSVRQGRINLIIETQEKAFNVWVDGTERLMAQKPIKHKNVAIKLFALLRKKAGVYQSV